MTRKVFLFLTVALCLCMENKTMAYSFSATNNGKTIYYNITSSSAPRTVEVTYRNTTSDYNSYSGVVDIPSTVIYGGNTYSVTSIGNNAFYNDSNLTSITIPNSVTSIGNSAFSNCHGLTSVTIGNSVDTIGNWAFYQCSGLTSVTIGNSVTTIGDYAFRDCSGLTGTLTIPDTVTTIGNNAFRDCSGLTSVTIGNSVTTIGDYAFLYCSGLTSTLTIPNSVTTIGNVAFGFCSGLTGISVDASHTIYSSNGGVLFNKNQTILICYPAGKTGNYIIPNTVTSIGAEAFITCSGLTSVTIPNSVTSIGDYAFGDCSGLTSVTIPNSVTSIGEGAFVNCGNLATYVQAITPPSIYINTFSSNALVYVPCGRTVVYQNATYWANLNIIDYAFFDVYVQSNNVTMGTASVTQFNTCANNNNVIIAATPNMGYRFVQWNDGNNQNPRRITLTQDTNLTAIFTNMIQGMYYVAINANNPNMGTVFGSGDYVQNGIATIGAIAKQGYRFTQWHDGNTTNPRAVTVTQDTNFIAIFTNITQGMYYVTVNSNNPSMGTVSSSDEYAANSNAVLTATPNTGYRFVQWHDGNKQNPRSITVTQDTVFTAEFGVLSANMFHVSVSSKNTGMGTVSGSGDYATNATASIAAVANTGYRFVQWNDGSNQNPRSITITQDTSFIAEFGVLSANMYHVTVNSNNTSMGTISGNGDYAANTTASIAAIANTGYRFVQWTDGDKQNPRIITVTQDTTFTAEFASATQNTYHITVLSNDQTKGSVIGGGDYAANTTTTIGAMANQGCYFVQWNDGNTDNPRTIILISDTVFTAMFASSSQTTYHVNVLSNDITKGSVTGSGNYEANTTISIGAIANQGYRFMQWNDRNKDNPRIINVTQDTTFIATFEDDVSITDISTSNINIYPNPARDNIHITLPEDRPHAVFTLYDMQGKMLIRKEINSQAEITVNNLAGGIYIYNIQTEKENYKGKLRIKN